MAICAVVRLNDNVVINKIMADPLDVPPGGTYLIPCDNIMCDIDWIWNGSIFYNPNSSV